MAQRYAFLSAGQSQGSKVGEQALFEDNQQQTAVRNPGVFPRAPIISKGVTQDRFTLPGTWPDKYKSFSVRGKATGSVLRLAPFNPCSVLYENQDVGASAVYSGTLGRAYPGYAQAGTQNEAAGRVRIVLNTVFQSDPAGLTIYRVSTGTNHILTSGWVNTAPGEVYIDSGSALDPAVVPGELFKLPLQVRATGTTTTVPSNVRFGGYTDGGSLLEAALFGGITDTLGGYTVQAYPIASYTSGGAATPLAAVVNCNQYRPGQRVQFTSSSTGHPDLALGTDYWVSRVDTDTPGTQKVYFSATRNGAEVLDGGVAASGNNAVALLPQHVSSTMAGCRIRFTSGALNGRVYDLTDNTLSSASPTDNFDLTTLSAMPSAPQTGDTFEIEPQQINGEDVTWAQFMHFVPECTLEGQAYGQAAPLAAVTAGVSSGASATYTGTFVAEGARVRLYDNFLTAIDPVDTPANIAAATTVAPLSGSMTGAGQVLYMVNVNYAASTFKLSTTYGGSAITDATVPAGTYTMFTDEHPDRGNPMPPGFNFDNTKSVSIGYQPYYGALRDLVPIVERGATYTVSLAQSMQEKLGGPICVLHTNVGGTSLMRREAAQAESLTATTTVGWFDPAVQLDWSASGEPDNCYARTVLTLECAKRAAAARGDTLKIVGIFFTQGETDAMWEEARERYEDGLRSLKRALREKVVELGMWDGPAETIPWWQPKLPSATGTAWGGDYANNVFVNDVIQTLVDEDPYMVTRSTDDAVFSYDAIHYSGDYLWQLGVNAFDDWESIAPALDDRTRIDICNQAIKNLGETKVITSLTEDTSTARLCNRYYGVAVQTLLESFPWQFATRTATLVQTTNTRADIDWQYAYSLPTNFLSIVNLGGDSAGVYQPEDVEHSIEGGVLYCNISDLVLRYTQRSPDPADYSQHFTNALAHQLAAEMAPAVAQGDKGMALAQSQMQMARYYVELAQQHTALRQRHADDQDTTYAWD